MTKIHRNGDVIIRLDHIAAAHIPDDNKRVVEIFFNNRSFSFRCNTKEDAKEYINTLQKEIECSD